MKYVMVGFMLLIGFATVAQGDVPRIEPCPCMIKVDSALISKCGYLIVPENRQQPAGRTIKLPFVYVKKSVTDSAVTLFTTGGPGYSTLANFTEIPARSDFFQFGSLIVFDQRGSKKAVPCLDCPEITAAKIKGYRENLSIDSLQLEAEKQCRKRLVSKGIDLSSYTTIESAADINDLRQALQLGPLNLMGISYSGGLMLTVAKNHPECVKSLILRSPLPAYTNYEEEGLFNINEAFDQVFVDCEADSTDKSTYGTLRERFHQYFAAITGKTFAIGYTIKGDSLSRQIHYTKKELLDALLNRLNRWRIREVPFVMNEMINGRHEPYIKEELDEIFKGDEGLSHGMRYSIYCSEQIAYSRKELVKKQELVLPWLAGYAFNNVDHAICDCWKVKPEPATAKEPVYSTVPAFITAGDVDPWCRPHYNRLIKRYMPNSQILIVHDQGHLPSFFVNGIDYLKMFMQDPYKKLVAGKGVVVE
ncbi:MULTISPECIES: alpha/beta hydrolase [Niastella]|uniref:Proline iminopeptidase n=1 Tax=Niastella soli TaxID=2821487 RepID=A0ABS3YZ47_9BACT|nr:alpha/beta fold hydrolase [Niastella soli]MBO9203204.1 alpha/beta fold hydrolase [Niastella soli]